MATTVFWIFAVSAVLTAVLLVLQRNPINAAISLVATMFSLAAIYVLLDAQFIGAIQVLVYAGAVMVLFLFVIMLLNLGEAPKDTRGPGMVTTALILVGLLGVELVALARYSPARLAAEVGAPLQPTLPAATDNVVRDVAAPLFQAYLVPFEVTSLLLLAAIVGAVVLAKRRI